MAEQKNTQKSNGVYSLQSGAFSIRENAESQKIDLTMAGLDAIIIELYRDSRLFYAVRSGHYQGKYDARKIGSQVKIALDIDTIVVKND